MRLRRWKSAAMTLPAALLLVASPAAAMEGYPLEVRDHLSLGYAPPCSLCHAKGNPGGGTVVTPFGWSMRARGLVVEDNDSVHKALDSLKADNVDSDGDGQSDIAELSASTDPNSSGPVPFPNGEQPGYGCGGHAPDPNERGEGAIPPLAIAALYFLRRKWKRSLSTKEGRP